MLEKVARTKKPVILSLGLAQLSDLKLAVKTLKKNGCKKIAILQCVTSYPAPISEQNLATIKDIKKMGVLSGLSDHTLGNTSAITSVALGGSIVEKHFNLLKNLKTVDSFFSANLETFKRLVKDIRETELAVGKVSYKLAPSSKKHLKGKRSIYIAQNIDKGEKFTKENLKIVRPNFGIHPKFFNSIIGKKSKFKLMAGKPFKKSYLK